MRVDVLVPDAAIRDTAISGSAAPDVVVPDGPQSARGDASAFARLVDAAGAILEGADRAETAFAAHRGGLQEMVVERARADIALQIAATAAQRTAQSISTVLGMQL